MSYECNLNVNVSSRGDHCQRFDESKFSLSLSEKTRKSYYLQMPEQRQHFLLSLCCRCSLTSVSNVCEANHRSLFCSPKRLNKVLKGCFEIPFILIDKSTMAFLTGQACCILKAWYTAVGQEQGFWYSVFRR